MTLRTATASVAKYVGPLLLCVFCAAGSTATRTVAAEDFYNGKIVTLFIDAAGGSYESYARLLAQHMPKYIPGRPTMIVKQMLGASGLRLANYMYNLAPKDGTEIAGVHAQIPTQPLFSRQGIQYNPNELSWIGNLTRDTFVEYMWHTSPVQSIADSRAKEAIIGGQAPGSMSIDTAILSNAIIGTKFKIVTGYSGLGETLLALQRGEINGGVAAYGEIVSGKPDWLKDRKIKFIAQLGLQKNKSIPDVPLLIDLIANPEDRQAMELFLSRGVAGKPYVAPPGLPEDRLAILRKAFDSTVKDPGFLNDAASQRFEINHPMTGSDLANFVAKENATPLSTVQRIDDAFAQYTTAR